MGPLFLKIFFATPECHVSQFMPKPPKTMLGVVYLVCIVKDVKCLVFENRKVIHNFFSFILLKSVMRIDTVGASHVVFF